MQQLCKHQGQVNMIETIKSQLKAWNLEQVQDQAWKIQMQKSILGQVLTNLIIKLEKIDHQNMVLGLKAEMQQLILKSKLQDLEIIR